MDEEAKFLQASRLSKAEQDHGKKTTRILDKEKSN